MPAALVVRPLSHASLLACIRRASSVSSRAFCQFLPANTTAQSASHRARGETPTMSFVLGANREGKKRVEGKANRIQSNRIGPVLVCVCVCVCIY